MTYKTAIITGITGQIGSYLAEFLLEKGYHVVGVVRRNSSATLNNIEDLKHDNLTLVYGNIIDNYFIRNILDMYRPDEYYNLAAQSFVATSFDNPVETYLINEYAIEVALSCIETTSKHTKFLQMSTSEMFGKNENAPQNEESKMQPVSPYAKAKYNAYKKVKEFRKNGLFACNAICFNTESPRRGKEFVTRKITYTIARIKLGFEKEIQLGNLKAKRDWGYAVDVVNGLWLMMQQTNADDFVFATGETHAIEEFLQEAFNYIGIKNWTQYVTINPKYYRPNEVNVLCGDYSKAEKILGWIPKVKFKELVKLMMEHDLK